MRLASLGLLLSGCAADIWDQRQVRCDELDTIFYTATQWWPLRVSSTVDPDEDCEVKTAGIRDAYVSVDDDVLTMDDVHRVDFEILDGVFASPSDYPVLDFEWPDYTPEGYSRITGREWSILDFQYGPGVPRLHVESLGLGDLRYETEAGDPYLEVVCDDCFINARVDLDLRIDVNELVDPDIVECEQEVGEGDLGLCTTLGLQNFSQLGHEICLGTNTRHLDFVGSGSDDVKVVLLGEPGDMQIESIAIETEGEVVVFTPDLDFTGALPLTVLSPQIQVLPGNSGPSLQISRSTRGVVVRRSSAVEREALCQSKPPVVDE